MKDPHRLIIGISGASGVVYGVRMIEILHQLDVETHLVVSKAGALTLTYETQSRLADLVALADHHYSIGDVGAAIASGSFRTQGMVIAPCSVKTMSEIASGVTSSLLSRAADVTLKERRRLILMVRETPFHTGHLRTMTALSEMGAVIAPPIPAFYNRPKTLDEMIDQSVYRALDLVGIEVPGLTRWGEDIEPGPAPGRTLGKEPAGGGEKDP